MKQITKRAFLGLIAATWLIVPHAIAETSVLNRPTAVAEIWNRTELYFGTAKSNGTVVTDPEFTQFIDNQVTPRFPDGLTLLTGLGQFKGSSGVVVREKSLVLILFYPRQMVDGNKKIQEIRDEYKKAFGQESVLRADSFSIISF